MDTIVVALITGVITGGFGILSGVVGAYLKFRNDLKAEYDKELRTARLEAYQGLWHLQQNLAKYDLPEPLTPQRLKELSEEMRDWYFGGGGLYLSGQSRETYFQLKELIQEVVSKKTEYGLEKFALDPGDSDQVLRMARALRRAMARDVGTRKPSALAGE